MGPTSNDPSGSPAAARGPVALIRDEFRARPFTYIGAIGVTILGPVAAHMIFPTEPLSLVVSGGLMLGAFFAFCALANRLFE